MKDSIPPCLRNSFPKVSESTIRDLPLTTIEGNMSRLSFDDASALSETLSKDAQKLNPHQFHDPALGENLFLKSIEQNDVGAVKALLKNLKVDPSAEDNYAIQWAASRGNAKIVKMLLTDPRVDPTAGDNRALWKAAMNGHVNVVDLLLQDSRVDPSSHNNEVIRSAAISGHADIVFKLLKDPRVNPSAAHNFAIKSATSRGYDDIVKALVQDPRFDFTHLSNSDARQILNSMGHYGSLLYFIAPKAGLKLLRSRVGSKRRANDAITPSFTNILLFQ